MPCHNIMEYPNLNLLQNNVLRKAESLSELPFSIGKLSLGNRLRYVGERRSNTVYRFSFVAGSIDDKCLSISSLTSARRR